MRNGNRTWLPYMRSLADYTALTASIQSIDAIEALLARQADISNRTCCFTVIFWLLSLRVNSTWCIDAAYSYACSTLRGLRVCLCVRHAPQKLIDRTRRRLGADSRGPKEPWRHLANTMKWSVQQWLGVTVWLPLLQLQHTSEYKDIFPRYLHDKTNRGQKRIQPSWLTVFLDLKKVEKTVKILFDCPKLLNFYVFKHNNFVWKQIW